MARRRKIFAAADLFCGLGGFSQGAEESGRVRTVLAVNHWRPAAYSFQANHPGARVICARIDDVDPRNDHTLPELDLLLASPECTHHSIARGGQPVEDQKRATPWHVVIWTECKRPQWVVVENVREFRDWGPLIQKRDKHGRPMLDRKGRPWMIPDPQRKGEIFRQWVRALESIGYRLDHQILNAADFGAATTRQRLFIIAKREDVRCKDIPWPDPTHNRDQWAPAASIIDWSLPSPSIFDRKRPLKPKTLRRIEVGLRRFAGQARSYLVQLYGMSTVADIRQPVPTVTAKSQHTAMATPFMVQYHGGTDPERDGTERQCDVSQPFPTIDTNPRYALVAPFQFKARGRNPGLTRPIEAPVPTILAARENHAIVQPYLIDIHNRRRDDTSTTIDRPVPTIVTKPGNSLVTPFLLPRQGFYDCRQDKPARSIDDPVPTVTASHSPGHLVTPYMVDVNHGEDGKTGDRCAPLDRPLGAVTTVRGKGLCLPFLTKYYGAGGATDPSDPLDTVTTKDRFGMATAHVCAGELGNYLAARAAELGDDSPEMRSLIKTMAELGVYDVGFRMLTNRELLLAQSFPADYRLDGAKTLAEQTKLIGNAVPPVFGRAICAAITEAA
jgi:DNA (cytosine-5)-methyltransferase 1